MKKNINANPSSHELTLMSLFSFLLYIVLAFGIYYFFHEQEISHAFEHGLSQPIQLLIGMLAGLATSAVIIFFSSRTPVKQVLDDFSIVRVISNLQISPFDRIQISIFAGFGEELLFRGAIQPLLGIWLTSFIFIAIHGYVSFRSAGHILFTLLLFGLSMTLGLLYEMTGLISAITTHAVYDMIMLWWVKKR